MHEHTPNPSHTAVFRYTDRATQTAERCDCGASRITDHLPRGDRVSAWTLPVAAANGSAPTGRPSHGNDRIDP